MKILLIGALNSNHTKRWANAMATRGHDVMVAHRPDQKDDMGDLHPNVKTAALKYGGKSYSYYLNIHSLRKICKDFKPDVVNAHYASGYGLLARLAKMHPLVISMWGSDIFDYPYHNKFNHNVICKNLNYCDAIASTSFAMAEEARKVLGQPNKEITVTPFGVDINRFTPPENHVNNNRPIIGIVKYLEPIYDIPLLIKAFAIVCEKREVRPLLHIYGGGKLLDELKELANSLGIGKDVVFFGTIHNAQIAKALQSFDIFVNCSVKESFGVAIVEAMSCGLPVVATDTAGYKEVVDDGVTGYILKDRKPETMAEKILELLGDSNLRASMGRAGRERVLELYDWEKNITIMETLYKKVSEK